MCQTWFSRATSFETAVKMGGNDRHDAGPEDLYADLSQRVLHSVT